MSHINQCVSTALGEQHHPQVNSQLQSTTATAILKPISHGNTIILLKNHFVLAQNNQVKCQFFHDSNKNWHCQLGDHHFALSSGMVLALDEQIWQFEQLGCQQQDLQLASQAKRQIPLQVQFHVSCDEEHITLTIKHQGQVCELGERVHHYPLLLLARQYQQDQQANFSHNSCGWLEVEQLTNMIGIDTSVLNVQLHRAKQQINNILPNQKLIQRRPGQVRLNCSQLEIIKDQQHQLLS